MAPALLTLAITVFGIFGIFPVPSACLYTENDASMVTDGIGLLKVGPLGFGNVTKHGKKKTPPGSRQVPLTADLEKVMEPSTSQFNGLQFLHGQQGGGKKQRNPDATKKGEQFSKEKLPELFDVEDHPKPIVNKPTVADITPAAFFQRLAASYKNRFYDTRFRPHFQGKPVMVHCSAFIGSISSVSEENMDYTIDFYFRQSWLDYRLQFNASVMGTNSENGKSDADSVINIPADFMDYLWRPPTYFVNAKMSSFHHVTRHNGFIRIRPSGYVTQSMRITITASCLMDFRFFPLDHQRCGLSIESFSLPAKDLVYHWSDDDGVKALHNMESEDPYLIESTLFQSLREQSRAKSKAVAFHSNVSTLPHLVVIGYSAVETFVMRHDGQNHSRLVLNIYFARSLGFYLIQVYLPATLMVITSWISFWISRNSAPARITLSVTTVLTIVTLTLQDYHSSLPKLSYLKALDLFHMTCFIFVFMVLVEYAIVSYVNKQFCRVSLTRRVGDEGSIHQSSETNASVEMQPDEQPSQSQGEEPVQPQPQHQPQREPAPELQQEVQLQSEQEDDYSMRPSGTYLANRRTSSAKSSPSVWHKRYMSYRMNRNIAGPSLQYKLSPAAQLHLQSQRQQLELQQHQQLTPLHTLSDGSSSRSPRASFLMPSPQQPVHRRLSRMSFTNEGEAVITTTLLTIYDYDENQMLAINDENEVIDEQSEEAMHVRAQEQRRLSGSAIFYSYLANHVSSSLPSQIEAASRLLFPLSFFVFNVLYWYHYYFNHHDNVESDLGFVEL